MASQVNAQFAPNNKPLSDAICTSLELTLNHAADQRGKCLPTLKGTRSLNGTADDAKLLQLVGANGQVQWFPLSGPLTDATTLQLIGSLSGTAAMRSFSQVDNGIQRLQMFAVGIDGLVYTPANGGPGPALNVLTPGVGAAAPARPSVPQGPAGGLSTARFANFGGAGIEFSALPGDLTVSLGVTRAVDERNCPVGVIDAVWVTLKRVFYRAIAGANGGAAPAGNGRLELLDVVHASAVQGFDARRSNASPPKLDLTLCNAVGAPSDTFVFSRILPNSYVLDLVGGYETLTFTSLDGVQVTHPNAGGATLKLASATH